MGQDEAEPPLRVQKAETFFDEGHVDVIVSLPGGDEGGLVELDLQRRPLLHRLDADVGRIADDGVETTFLFTPTRTLPRRGGGNSHFEDLRKLLFPVETVDPVLILVAQQVELRAVVEIRTDQGVSAADVPGKVGESALLEELDLVRQGLPALPLQDLEEERELRHLDGLGVDVHAVDAVQQNPLAFRGGQPPFAACGLIENRPPPLRPLLRSARHIAVPVPVEEALVGLDQERAGAASGVEDPEPVGPGEGPAFKEAADRFLDDIIDDVFRGVEDAARLLHLRFVFHLRLVAGGEADDLAEELLIHPPEDVGGKNGEFIRGIGVI